MSEQVEMSKQGELNPMRHVIVGYRQGQLFAMPPDSDHPEADAAALREAADMLAPRAGFEQIAWAIHTALCVEAVDGCDSGCDRATGAVMDLIYRAPTSPAASSKGSAS